MTQKTRPCGGFFVPEIGRPSMPGFKNADYVEVSADGETFETLVLRRRREERSDIRWRGGTPTEALDTSTLRSALDADALRG